MGYQYCEPSYLKISLDKAYIMGLESAVALLEKSIKLSPEGQREMLERLKEMIQQEKAEKAMLK